MLTIFSSFEIEKDFSSAYKDLFYVYTTFFFFVDRVLRELKQVV